MKNKTEIDILYKHYNKAHDAVKDDDYCKEYAHEKIIHSLQVIGAGNLILKNEPSLHNRSEGFDFCAKNAYIFHDIGRFFEITEIYNAKKQNQKAKCDHGVAGADILSQMPEYSDARIIIPVRHHGHLYNAFVKDIEYNAIKDNALKKEVEDIWRLTQDADKIANLYLVAKQYDKYGGAWISPEDELYGKINPISIEVFKNRQLFPRKDILSHADSMVATLSWVFDLNYKTSFAFVKKHNLVDGLINIIKKYDDNEILITLASLAKNHIEEKLS